jgi:DNA polymerase-4
MDAFYASVEQRDDPSLRGKPLVVGGGSNRGVVAAASYEAREFGIHSAMPMRDARRRCPDLLRVAPRMGHYQNESKKVFSVFREFTPVIEGLSLDEAFLDITASRSLFGSAVRIARQIKQRILDECALTASVGVAPNKLVAKISSDLDKPDGLVVVTEENLHEVLDPLPARVIPGIGRETLARLEAAGIRTILQLRTAPDRILEPVFGRFAQRTRDRAAGIDTRPVVTSGVGKSISAEQTFEVDLESDDAMRRELLRLADRTAARLRAKSLVAGTIQLKIRQSDFTTYTRQRALHPPGNGTDTIYELAWSLLRRWQGEFPAQRIRLLGVGGSELMPDRQQDLFSDMADGAASPVDETIDQIRERFGRESVGRARTLN